MTTVVGTACLFVMLGATVTADYDDKPSKGYGDSRSLAYDETRSEEFEAMRTLLKGLEDDVGILSVGLSDVSTMSAAVDDRLNLITDRHLPAINSWNVWQYNTISLLEKQMFLMTARTDAAFADIAKWAEAFSEPDRILQNQATVLKENADINEMQREFISNMTNIMAVGEQELEDKINTTIRTDLASQMNAVKEKSDEMEDFVDIRKCEYGSANVVPQNAFVSFLTKFEVIPSVAMTTTGFFARLDDFHYSSSDRSGRLAFQKTVENVTSEGFYVGAEDLSEGGVELAVVFINYMACQYLD